MCLSSHAYKHCYKGGSFTAGFITNQSSLCQPWQSSDNQCFDVPCKTTPELWQRAPVRANYLWENCGKLFIIVKGNNQISSLMQRQTGCMNKWLLNTAYSVSLLFFNRPALPCLFCVVHFDTMSPYLTGDQPTVHTDTAEWPCPELRLKHMVQPSIMHG